MSEIAYRNHPVWAQVSQLEQWANSAEFSAPQVIGNEQFVFARDKITATAKVVTRYLEQTPAILSSIHGLNQIHSHLQNCINEVQAFLSNQNPAHLVNAANQIDQGLIPSLWSFLPRLHELPPELTVDLISQTRESAAKAIEIILGLKNSLAAEVEQLRLEVSNNRNSIQSLDETLTNQRNEALAINAKIQQEFAESETRRAASFNEKLQEFAAITEAERKATAEAANKSLENLSRTELDARRIVQVVGNIGATGNFQKIADNETGQANNWRRITVALFGLGIAVAIVTFIKFLNAEPTPEHAWSAAIRLLYAIAVTAPAWYAAKESARHRTNADSARRTELELASLGPFIELMPEEKKVAIREALVEKYFGNVTTPHEVTPAGSDMKEILIEAIRAIKK
jgi:hypothetical protein